MSDKFDFKKLSVKKENTPKTTAKPKKRVVYQEVEEAPIEAVSPQTTVSPTSTTVEITTEAPVSEVKTSEVKTVSDTKSLKASKEKSQKVGRKSWKEEGVSYTRMAFDTPNSTKQKIKQLLAGKFYDKCISQDEMINIALKDFIKKHYKE